MQKKVQLNPRKIPTQERSLETVAAIYQAAAQVFSKTGYADTTTDHIAERAGVSIGTLYQYFPGKDAILLGLWEQHMNKVKDAAQKIVGRIQQQGMIDRTMIRMILEHNLYDHAQHTLFIGSIGWPEDIVQKQKELGLYIKKCLEESFCTSANVRIKNRKIAAHILWEVVRALIHDYILYWTNEIEPNEFVDELSDMLNHYIFSDNASCDS